MARPKHITEEMETIDLPAGASCKNQRERLLIESGLRGMNLKMLVGACYEFALSNTSLFDKPLKGQYETGGEYIGGLVPKGTKQGLDDWASYRLATRCSLLSFILNKVIEDDMIDDVYRFKLDIIRQKNGVKENHHDKRA